MGSDLMGSDLMGSDLMGSDLLGSDLMGSDLMGSDLMGSDLMSEQGGDRGLARVIGTWGLAAGIVNVTVGGGIFRLPAGVAAAIGVAAPLAYLACTIAMGLIVL